MVRRSPELEERLNEVSTESLPRGWGRIPEVTDDGPDQSQEVFEIISDLSIHLSRRRPREGSIGERGHKGSRVSTLAGAERVRDERCAAPERREGA